MQLWQYWGYRDQWGDNEAHADSHHRSYSDEEMFNRRP